MAFAGFPLANRRPAALLPLGILAGAALVGAADALAAGWLVLAALVTFLGVVLLARHFTVAAPYVLIGAALLQRLPVGVGGWHLYPEYAALGVVAVIATGGAGWCPVRRRPWRCRR